MLVQYQTLKPYSFLTGLAACSLFFAAHLARLLALLDFCAILASRFNCWSALMTSASSLETFLPLMTRKPGVGGMGVVVEAAAAAAAAERRVMRGVERGEGLMLEFGVSDYIRESRIDNWNLTLKAWLRCIRGRGS